jgi:hypothetical protein
VLSPRACFQSLSAVENGKEKLPGPFRFGARPVRTLSERSRASLDATAQLDSLSAWLHTGKARDYGIPCAGLPNQVAVQSCVREFVTAGVPRVHFSQLLTRRSFPVVSAASRAPSLPACRKAPRPCGVLQPQVWWGFSSSLTPVFAGVKTKIQVSRKLQKSISILLCSLLCGWWHGLPFRLCIPLHRVSRQS